MKAPAGSYLILGRPRSRTAWLSALLFGDIPCYHDELFSLKDLLVQGDPFGLAAPSLPITDFDGIERIYSEAPILVIDRTASECYESLSRFAGLKFMPSNIQHFEERFQVLLDRLPTQRRLTIRYSDLDQYETVNRIHEHCVGGPLAPERFHVFNLLRIEQHLPKVMQNSVTAVGRRS
jgi:hypothetical protein